MINHTPGPWLAQRDPNAIASDDWCIGAQGQIDKVAVCSELDARLIAAAPELLEALQAILGANCSAAHNAAIHRAQDVIAKATGEVK